MWCADTPTVGTVSAMSIAMTRYAASAAMALALGVSTACSSDDPEPDSTNRGGGETDGQTSVENVFIAPAYAIDCSLQVDAPAQLSFTAVNDSSTEAETLSEITSPAAERVEIDAPAGALEIAPESSIAAGQPVENVEDADAPDRPFRSFMFGLDDSAEPGKSIPVTFTFERAGDITLQVAVDACPNQSE